MSLSTIREHFRGYYLKTEIIPPRSIEKREFGFMAFGEAMMLRHQSFRTGGELRDFLVKSVPAHVYSSAAYYQLPTEEMDRKGWIEADLVFDIDADHLPTPCKIVHDSWKCERCGKEGKGASPPGICTCGGKIKETVWCCDQCLEAARSQVIGLLKILMDDFGLTSDEIEVFFSGHRGYHIHVEHDHIRQLDQFQRKEVTDYITATGLSIGRLIWEAHDAEMGKVVYGPNMEEPGWRGRLAKAISGFTISATKGQMETIGLSPSAIKALLGHRELLLEARWEDVPWNLKGIGLDSWRKITKCALDEERIVVDTVVTTDIHRLIRVPMTLHGKTGLVVKEVPASRIDVFDPLSEAVAFTKGHLSIHVKSSPRFRIGDEEFGPYKECRVELPAAPALLLLCKGLAEVT